MLSIEITRTFSMPENVRKEVLTTCNEAFGQPFDILFSMLSPDGLHFLGRIDGRLVAHLVMTDRNLRLGSSRWLRAGYIDAVATLPGFRKQGHATALLQAAISSGKGRYDLFALATNVPELYAGCGFAKWEGRQLVENENGVGLMETEEQGNLMILPFGSDVPCEKTLPVVSNWRPGGGY